jgi:hypothetical protein
MSEDAFLGDAQYTIAVDGVTVTTGTVTTLHSSGASQEVTVGLGGGSHQVTVRFLNDAYVPGVGDRNLYVNYVKYDGVDQNATPTELYTTGNMFSITVPVAPPPPPSGGSPRRAGSGIHDAGLRDRLHAAGLREFIQLARLRRSHRAGVVPRRWRRPLTAAVLAHQHDQ